MKKIVIACMMVMCAFFISTGTASATLVNWGFDASGTGSNVTAIKDYLDTVGTAYISNTFTDLQGNGVFKEISTFRTISHDNGDSYTFGSNKEITATFTGTGTLNGLAQTFTFSNGTINVYADTVQNYKGATGAGVYYGANDGSLIGTFTLLNGGGGLDTQYGPSGQIAANFVATYLKSGYWFDTLGNPLLSLPSTQYTLGLTTTNATLLSQAAINADTNLSTQYKKFFVDQFGGTYPGDLQQPYYFYVSNAGQFRVDVVPEPTSMLLLGMGLLGIVPVIRRKKVA